MRKILALFCFLVLSLNCLATQYFVSAAGNDNNTGTSSGASWKTTVKVNSFSFVAGDIVQFNRGETFVGPLIPRTSGSSGNPITFTAYGSGALPIITGLSSITAWTNLGSNIWESTSAASTVAYTNMVVINGVNTGMGRLPNSGMYFYQSFTQGTTNTITSSNLSGSPNWTGAELALFNTTFTIERRFITSQSGGTLSYVRGANDLNFESVNQGFIIQNDARTLDVVNEWYYNTATKKIRVFNTVSPTNFQIATIDTLTYLNGRNFITFNNISFQGANIYALLISNSNHCTVTNCAFNFVGRDAIFANVSGNSQFLDIESTTFNQIHNSAINAYGQSTANATIKENNIKNCGLTMGAGTDGRTSGQGFGNYGGIWAFGQKTLFEHNRIDSMGYLGIHYFGDTSLVQYNHVSNALQLLHDGGGIYTWDGAAPSPGPTMKGIIVRYNIVHDVVSDMGFYFDDGSNGIEAYGNTAFNCSTGFYSHMNYNMNIHNNTAYANGQALLMIYSNFVELPPSNLRFMSNIWFGKTATNLLGFLDNNERTIPAMTSDSNYWARPIAQNTTIINTIQRSQPNNVFVVGSFFNLAQWRTFTAGKGFPLDVHSNESPVTISNVGQLFLGYNTATHDSTIGIPAGTWIDVRGVTYNTGSTILSAGTSVVLINTGTNIAPVANAGVDKSITLPTSTVSVTGSGTDADGTIASTLWTQVSGPATATFSSATTSATNINSMTIAGIYKFQFKVTDNFGLTGVDTMQVTVNAIVPVNQPPVVSAGGNKNITLPTSTVTQVGSATDPDGTIASVLWTQSAGNPVAATIVSPTNTTTVINGLVVSGNYQFTLTATDNLGLTGSQTITVIVNPPNPVPPVANAGADQVITWPTNSVTLSGSGTDADGVIISYNWIKLSGGVAAITNANSASTTVTGLDIGVYQFQLTVTDNSGSTATDVMQVTLNKGSASLAYTVLSRVFNNTPQAVGILTNPAGLTTSTLYNGVGATPINRGVYSVNSNITDPHWSSTAISGTYTITPKPGTITVSNLSFVYDGTGKSVSVATSDPFVTVTTYDGSLTLPINANNNIQVITKTNDPNYSVTPDTSIMVINQATPTLTSWTPTTPITYPTAIGGSQLNAVWSVAGANTYTPISGTIPNAGTLTIVDDFVPSSANYKSVLGTTRTITVNKGATTIAVSDTTQFFDGTVKTITAIAGQSGTVTVVYTGAHTAVGDYPFTATYSSANYTAPSVSGTLHILANSAGIKITNFSNRVYTGSPISPTVTTNPAGLAYTITFNGSLTVPTAVGTYTAIATLTLPNVGADTVIMTIIKATPVITWPVILDIAFGTALSATQYNQTANVAGSFVNSPLIGVILPVGVNQVLNTTFTPTDASNYNTVSATNTITVTQVSASMTFQNVTFTYDGTAKSPIVVTSPVNLTGVVITGAPQTAAGSYPISATMTNTNYSASPISGTLTINKSDNYTLTWTAPAPVQVGSKITLSILNPASTIAGTFTFNYPVGYTLSNTGTILITGTFHPTDGNYNDKTISVPLSVFGSPLLDWYIINGSNIYLNLP